MDESHGDDAVRLLAEVVRGYFDQYPNGFTVPVDEVGGLINLPHDSMRLSGFVKSGNFMQHFREFGVEYREVSVQQELIPGYPLVFPAFQFYPGEVICEM
jgi:hypothetical protein